MRLSPLRTAATTSCQFLTKSVYLEKQDKHEDAGAHAWKPEHKFSLHSRI